MAKKPRPTDEELNKLSHEDFVVWFMDYNDSVINRYIFKRLIPNRYEAGDIKSYMAERILDIMNKRKEKSRPIANPRTYFGRLIDYWCIEYQRMHGYIYGMPKRPRCVEAEADISKYGFVYLDSNSNESSGSEAFGFNEAKQLAYVDKNTIMGPDTRNLGYDIKGDDPGQQSEVWQKLMLMVMPEDRPVMTCLFIMNMSIPESAEYLKIPISAAYKRRDHGLSTISGTIASFVDLDEPSWRVLNNINNLEPSSVDITELFNNLS